MFYDILVITYPSETRNNNFNIFFNSYIMGLKMTAFIRQEGEY